MALRTFRRCLECDAVRTAADFKPAKSRHHASGQEVRCPACGHIAPRWAFTEVEPPEDAGRPERPSG